MDKFFKILTQFSTSIVFFVLLATAIVLYTTAKPAIEEFGAHFIIEPLWNVDIKQNDASKIVDNASNLTQGSTPENSTQDPLQDGALTTKNSEDFSKRGTHEDDFNTEKDVTDIGNVSIDSEDFESDDLDSEDFDLDESIPTDDEFDTTLDSNNATNNNIKTQYGGAVAIVGTLFSTLIAMVFAIPISLGIAVFLSEIAVSRVAGPIGIAIELLAAIPSIIYGMWALFYFGPFIASIFGGHSVSLLIAGLTLAVMVIPFMAALSRDAINTTPDILKESAYAMGATKFEVIKDVIFPYSKSGIIGSIIISLGRAMGETMAVAFVIGGIFKFATHVTDPTTSIPVVLANNFAESSGLSMSALFYLALILFVLSFITILVAKRFFLRRS